MLVGSDPKGGIRVFDFDSYLPKATAFENQIARLNNLRNNANAAMYTGQQGNSFSAMHSKGNKIPTVSLLEPIHCIELPNSHCNTLAWHPTNQNQIVAGFHANQKENSIHVYDLGDFPTDPLIRLKPERNAKFSEVCDVLCFNASWKHGGGAPNVAAAGGRGKVVKV